MESVNLLIFSLLLYVSAYSQLHGKRGTVIRVAGDINSYLLHNGRSFLVPDNETVTFLGFELDSLEEISGKTFELFEPAEPLESLIRKDNTADAAMHIYSTKFKILQDNNNLIKESVFIWWTSNPSISIWKGRYFASSRGVRSNVLRFSWMDSTFHVITNESYLGVGPDYIGIESLATGADARIIVLEENRLLLDDLQPQRMRLAELSVHVGPPEIVTVDYQYRLLPLFFVGIRWVIHKNWSPFVYNGSVCLIETINPLRVLQSFTPATLEGTGGKLPELGGELEGVLLSHAEPAAIDWDYGDLRGGTTAKLIDDDHYLLFFHSRRQLPNNILITYFMGALTFTSQPPFTIKTISRVPMFHSRFYDGAWGEIHKFDYVVFPMHFFFANASGNTPVSTSTDAMSPIIGAKEDLRVNGKCNRACLAGHDIILSMGAQDREGWVHRINMLELYETMVPVKPASQPQQARQAQAIQTQRRLKQKFHQKVP